MANTTTKEVSDIEQRRKAQSKYILEMDYHLLNVEALMKASSYIAGVVQNTLKPEDSHGDVECLISLLFLMKDHLQLMVESTDRRCGLEVSS